MDSTVITSVVAAAGGIGTALLGFWSSRFTSRQSRAAAAEQQRLDSLKDFRATMEAITENLRKEVSDERARREADRLEHQRQIDAVQARLRDLERERLQHRGAIEALNHYARALVRLLREHNVTPPAPPESFTERTWP